MEGLQADMANPSRPRFYSKLQRRPQYYICTAFMPSMQNLGNRMDMNTTMLLTIIALRLTTQTILPKVNYMTWLDYYYAYTILYMISVIFANVIFQEQEGTLAMFYLFISSWLVGHTTI